MGNFPNIETASTNKLEKDQRKYDKLYTYLKMPIFTCSKIKANEKYTQMLLFTFHIDKDQKTWKSPCTDSE